MAKKKMAARTPSDGNHAKDSFCARLAPGFHAAIFCLPFIYLRSRSTEWAKEGLLAVSLVFRYPLYDVQKAQTTTETTRCAIVFAHVTYDTIQLWRWNADDQRINAKKETLETTEKPKIMN